MPRCRTVNIQGDPNARSALTVVASGFTGDDSLLIRDVRSDLGDEVQYLAVVRRGDAETRLEGPHRSHRGRGPPGRDRGRGAPVRGHAMLTAGHQIDAAGGPGFGTPSARRPATGLPPDVHPVAVRVGARVARADDAQFGVTGRHDLGAFGVSGAVEQQDLGAASPGAASRPRRRS